MTKGITVGFIKANERNLELAFHVEEAMPVVRTELIKEFFICVEKQLTENVAAEEEWEIRAIGTKGLWIRKKHWERLKVGEDWWGISFSHNEGYSSINVADISEISDSVKEKVEREFRKSIGKPKTEGPYICHYLKDDLSDLNGLDFLKKMVNDEEREAITKDLADKLAKLADAVDRVLSNHV